MLFVFRANRQGWPDSVTSVTTQRPAEQSPAHVAKHAPQFCGSDERSAHVWPHFVRPPKQSQWLLTQASLAEQATLHVPQCAASLDSETHTVVEPVVHAVVSRGHTE